MFSKMASLALTTIPASAASRLMNQLRGVSAISPPTLSLSRPLTTQGKSQMMTPATSTPNDQRSVNNMALRSLLNDRDKLEDLLADLLELERRRGNDPTDDDDETEVYEAEVWEMKETEENVFVQVDMPGLGKEDVKLCVKKDKVVIKAEGAKEANGKSGRRYFYEIELPEDGYKKEKMKAEMKNGVLKVVIPKVKEEERNDVFLVKVD